MNKLILILSMVVGVTLFVDARCHTEYVRGLDRYGDNFLSVRTGPGTRFQRKDTLHTGDTVGVCEYRGSWKLIYYGIDGSCYLDNGRPQGRCYSGWAYGKYLR